MWRTILGCALVASAVAARHGDGFWSRQGRLYPTLPIAVADSRNDRCRADSELLLAALEKKDLWAMTMWDSSAKTPVGVLYGSIFQMGNFDECVRVAEPVRAQFCMAQVTARIPDEYLHPENPYSLRMDPRTSVWSMLRGSRIDPSKVPRDVINWGLCVPASCTPDDLRTGINEYLRGIAEPNGTTYSIDVVDNFCTRADEADDVTPGEIAFWCFAATLLALTVSSTIADLLQKDRVNVPESPVRSLWMSFSVNRNWVKLTGSSEDTGNRHLDVLHGIKAVSIISIVLGHRIGISLSVSSSNFQEIEEHLRTGRALFFVHTDLVVDTFFFVSGLLACFFLLRIFSVRVVNPLLAVVVRLLRLAPAYFFVIWYQATVADRLGSGPLWKAMGKEENRFCRENWWANVLFISNYVKPKEMCMTHSWYIPCDFHFFVMATCLALVLVKRRRLGLVLLAGLAVVSAVIPAAVTYANRIQPMIIFYHDFLSRPRDNESFHMLYVKSHNRATVYLIGMAVGYFLYTYKDSVKRVSKKLTVSAFLVWLLLMFAPMAYGSLYYNTERPYDPLEAAIFSSARRVSWAIGFAVFVVAHRFGAVPVLSRLLSSRPAVFLSNITYGVYLLHFNLISADVFQTRAPKPFRIGNVLMDGVGDLLVSATFAVVLFLVLEVPFKRVLREFLLGKRMRSGPEPRKEEQERSNNNNNNNNQSYNCSVTVDGTTVCTDKV